MGTTANRLVEACGSFWKKGEDREGKPLDLYLFLRKASELGQDLAEYALLLSLVALVVIVAMVLLGTELSTIFEYIREQWMTFTPPT